MSALISPPFPQGNVPLRSPTPPSMANNLASSRFRSTRSMPSWVTETHDRVGPEPPPPPGNADPEYEVIDVANQQQYSNAPPPIPLKSPEMVNVVDDFYW
ncbi:conserved hypothetical protein [Culex quinquefasciatus]|uniref:Uncharacterized protein n=1 Tax=Culex quinquefasciatus TaxID=7176 RepID=B0WIC0_CULQU|nr:conserved hypothetical protein [Culex quinquefasciatus]|eukprot:XP_001848454.1 conserved hypothetical protein [Culex quinquefasciatus]